MLFCNKKKKIYRVTHRLLLLGAGESGKSTIVKQMQIINMKGFCPEERERYVLKIYSNIREAMISILGAMKTKIPTIYFQDNTQSDLATKLLDSYTNADFSYTKDFFDDCQTLWATNEVQACYERSNEYHLIDSAKYFLDKISDVRKLDYLPSDQDILRCRIMTTQILEIRFKVKDAMFHMFDVGGTTRSKT